MGFIMGINIFMILTMFLVGYFIQEMSSSKVYFGIRVPVDYDKKKLLPYKKEFKKNYAITTLIILITNLLLSYILPLEYFPMILLILMFAQLGLLNLCFYKVFYKLKRLKKEEGWTFKSGKVIVVDTNFRKKDNVHRISVSNNWMYLSWGIILVNIVITLIVYPKLPGQIPQHFNYKGEVDIWIDKNYINILLLPIIQIIMTVAFTFLEKTIKNSKQILNGGRIDRLIKNSRRSRYFLSVVMMLTILSTNIIFTFINLATLRIIDISGYWFTWLIFISSISPIFIISYFIIKFRRQEDNDIEQLENITDDGKIIIDRDDDENYILGTMYYNKNDPALWVEKRVGVGMDFNYARPAAKVFMGIIISILIGVFVLIGQIPNMTKERQVDVTPDSIKVYGHYGLSIAKSDIESITVEDKMPPVLLKSNGAAIANKLMGKFVVKNAPNAVLFVGDSEKPVIQIKLNTNKYVFINYSDVDKTYGIYELIIDKMALNK